MNIKHNAKKLVVQIANPKQNFDDDAKVLKMLE